MLVTTVAISILQACLALLVMALNVQAATSLEQQQLLSQQLLPISPLLFLLSVIQTSR